MPVFIEDGPDVVAPEIDFIPDPRERDVPALPVVLQRAAGDAEQTAHLRRIQSAARRVTGTGLGELLRELRDFGNLIA